MKNDCKNLINNSIQNLYSDPNINICHSFVNTKLPVPNQSYFLKASNGNSKKKDKEKVDEIEPDDTPSSSSKSSKNDQESNSNKNKDKNAPELPESLGVNKFVKHGCF